MADRREALEAAGCGNSCGLPLRTKTAGIRWSESPGEIARCERKSVSGGIYESHLTLVLPPPPPLVGGVPVSESGFGFTIAEREEIEVFATERVG
jgi:hypothetical protein